MSLSHNHLGEEPGISRNWPALVHLLPSPVRVAPGKHGFSTNVVVDLEGQQLKPSLYMLIKAGALP